MESLQPSMGPGAGQGLAGAMGAQSQQGGIADILKQYPNIDQTEAAGLTGLAQMGDPDVFMSELQKAAMSGPEKPENVEIEDGYILTPEGPQPIEGWEERKARIAAAGRNQTTVNLPAMESAYDKKTGEIMAEENVNIQKTGTQAAGQAEQYRRLGDALAATYTGAGGKAVLQLKRIAGAMGMEVEGVEDAQLAQKISRELALTLRNPESGAGMPGQLSNADRDYLESMVPGLETSAGGNKLMVDYMVRLANRKAEVAAEARKYIEEHGRLDANWYSALAKYVEANPLFTEADLAKAQSAGTAQGGSEGLSDEDLINKYK
jgi:hypothetical protein